MSSQYSYSIVQNNLSMGHPYSQAGRSASGSRHFQNSDRSNDLNTLEPRPYVEGDISSEATRKHQTQNGPHVKFGNVVIESGDVMGTAVMGEQVEFGEDGDILADALDREVLNTILETGTDEKGRRVLKQQYAKLGPEERRQREIRLAQYSGFVMRSDGTLDYGIDTPKKTNFIKNLLSRLL